MNSKNKRKLRWNIVFILIAISSIVIRLLIEYQFDKSALLYAGVPFLIALALLWIERPENKDPNLKGNWKRSFFNLVLDSLIIMLGSSIILFEGFVCVVMFMPIYFTIILIVFIIKYLAERFKNRKNSQLFSHVLPLLVLLSSFEGTHPFVSMERHNEVTVTKVVDASLADIKRNMLEPIELQKDRGWFLALFPMPYHIQGESLMAGDIHQIYFRYHRWFVTNTHSGSMKLLIENVDERKITTRFISDTSYIANYLNLKSTEIQLSPINNNQTQVTLSVSYDRLLDPAWYFDPLQRYGIAKSVEFLIAEIMVKHEK